MGYTHYWTPSSLTNDGDWATVTTDIGSILAKAREGQIRLADWEGQPGTEPEFTNERISFNGVDDHAHETFSIVKGETNWNFCKTAQKPYDTAVTAVLIYLHSRFEFAVTSDGEAAEWLPGLELLKLTFPGQDDEWLIPIKDREERRDRAP